MCTHDMLLLLFSTKKSQRVCNKPESSRWGLWFGFDSPTLTSQQSTVFVLARDNTHTVRTVSYSPQKLLPPPAHRLRIGTVGRQQLSSACVLVRYAVSLDTEPNFLARQGEQMGQRRDDATPYIIALHCIVDTTRHDTTESRFVCTALHCSVSVGTEGRSCCCCCRCRCVVCIWQIVFANRIVSNVCRRRRRRLVALLCFALHCFAFVAAHGVCKTVRRQGKQ